MADGHAGWEAYHDGDPGAESLDTIAARSAPLFPAGITIEDASARQSKHRPQTTSVSGLRLVDPCTLQGKSVPVRRWIVAEWLPETAVTLHYAAGGEGKTLLAQQLMTACATGTPWLGMATARCPVFGIFAEDDEDEIHRRQEAINRAIGTDYTDLELMRWACPVGEDNVLVRFEPDGTPVTTPRFNELLEVARKHGAKLIVIDTAADTFGGSENDRGQVSAFVKGVLGRIALELQAAVLLNAHPSKSSLAGGAGNLDSGSTAWTGSARSRWSLETPRDEEGQVTDSSARTLRRTKANYASRDAEIKLRWAEGTFSLAEPRTGFDRVASASRCEGKFLELLEQCTEQGVNVSAARNAGNYAPRIFSKRPNNGAYMRREFEAAMNALFAADRIHVVPYGKTSENTKRIEPRTSDDDAGEV